MGYTCFLPPHHHHHYHHHLLRQVRNRQEWEDRGRKCQYTMHGNWITGMIGRLSRSNALRVFLRFVFFGFSLTGAIVAEYIQAFNDQDPYNTKRNGIGSKRGEEEKQEER